MANLRQFTAVELEDRVIDCPVKVWIDCEQAIVLGTQTITLDDEDYDALKIGYKGSIYYLDITEDDFEENCEPCIAPCFKFNNLYDGDIIVWDEDTQTFINVAGNILGVSEFDQLLDTFTYPGNEGSIPMVNPTATGLIPIQTFPLIVVDAITLDPLPAYNYSNGAGGVGATWTGQVNGAITALFTDGVTPFVGMRIGIAGESNDIFQGVGVINQLGNAGSPYIITRTIDADQTGELDPQIIVATSGSNANKPYTQQTNQPIVGTDPIVYLPGFVKSANWSFNGNTVGAETWIGTKDNFDFPIRTFNVERVVVSATDIYFGVGGITNAAPVEYTIHATSGVGANIAGADLNFAVSQSTGNAVSGDIVFFHAPSGIAGSDLNALAEGWRFKGTNGALYRAGVLYSIPHNPLLASVSWGFNCLAALTTGVNNVALGNSALDANTTGERNIAIGTDAMGANITGSHSIGIGNGALEFFVGSGTSDGIATAVGDFALGILTTGRSNSAFGNGAGGQLTTGSSNTFLGTYAGNNIAAGFDIQTGNMCMALGYGALIGGNFDSVISFAGSGATANAQIIFGGASNPGLSFTALYNEMYLGRGITYNALAPFTIHPTSATGSDAAGANFNFAVSRATGNSSSGDIVWQYAPPGVSGSTLTALTAGMTFKGINGGLELSSTLGYLLLNRLTTAQKNALTAVDGMLVYDSTLGKFQGREAGAWVNLI